jgi:hypothetical protein
LFVGPFCFRFGGLRCLEASEGLAPSLRSRTIGRVSVRPWRPRSLMSAKREPRPTEPSPGYKPGYKPGPGSADPRKKTGRSIRCAARIRPLEKPEPVSNASSGRAPALHARECLTTPAFESYPFGFAHARRMRPLSVGRAENALHPATDLSYVYSDSPSIDYDNMVNRKMAASAAHRVAS